MASPDVLLRPEALEAFVADVFCRSGMSGPDAAIFAGALVQTDLWGKSSHGVMRVPHYVKRLQSGAVIPRPEVKIVRGGGAFEIMDGDDGPGHLVGRAAMLRAVTLADDLSVGVVGVTRSNHFGAAALYARLAVDRGMVGIAMTNSTPKLVAPGGSKAISGNNPVAVGVPSNGDFPFLLDMSPAAVAGGKLLLAGQKGEKIPPGVALDAEGRPTDDPAAAFAGQWLPIGGVKGLGLSYAVDLLCGLIPGGPFGLGMKSQFSQSSEPSGTGHMMIALRLDAVITQDELRRRMEEFVTAVKASPMHDASSEMLVPGEAAHRTELERRAHGIPLPAGVYEELRALGELLDVPGGLAPDGA
jgi:LDH2 family malate/lactate/ureidoglycolate dehydrogenase